MPPPTMPPITVKPSPAPFMPFNEMISLLYLAIGFFMNSQSYPPPYKIIYPIQQVSSSDLDKIKQVALDRLNRLYNESISDTLKLKPINMDAYKFSKFNIENAKNYTQLGAQIFFSPDQDYGLYPIIPIAEYNTDPFLTTSFQFEQGSVGWYWGFLNFDKSRTNLSNNCSLMFALNRVEVGDAISRNKYNLPLCSTTLYQALLGITYNGVFYTNKYKFFPGKFEAKDATHFIFESQDPDNEIMINFQGNGNNKFILDCNFIDVLTNKSVKYKTNVENKLSSPYLDFENGCAPCTDGSGTLYTHFTLLNSTNTYINGNNIPDNSGEGWIERQWAGNKPMSLGMNLYNNFKLTYMQNNGLGKYIWIVLLFKDKQYMIYKLFNERKPNQVGDKITDTFYNLYKGKETTFNNTGITLEITDIISFDNCTWLTGFKITIGDKIYSLRSKEYYEKSFGYDISGNFHYTGNSSLVDISPGNKDPNILSGFIENSQFQTNDVFYENLRVRAGLTGDIKYMTAESKFTIDQSTPSIEALGAILGVILYIIKYIPNKSSNFLNNDVMNINEISYIIKNYENESKKNNNNLLNIIKSYTNQKTEFKKTVLGHNTVEQYKNKCKDSNYLYIIIIILLALIFMTLIVKFSIL